MTWIVALFGIVITLLGIVGLVRPPSLLRFVQLPWSSQVGLYLSIGIRAVFGLVLLMAASASRFPEAFWILGIVSLVAALVVPFMGLARLQGFVQWWTRRPPGLIRGWSLVVVAFGVFLLYGSM